MISRNLFFRLVRQDIKKRIWCPILIFIVLFLALEVCLLMETEEYLRYSYVYAKDIVTYVKEYFFGRHSRMVSVVTCFIAFLCGISGYAYLHSKIQVDTYHSLPVSRSQLFWSKYISGVLQFFVPFVIHALSCAGIAAGKGAFTTATIPAVISYIALQLVVFVLAYSVTVLAMELTGNMIVAVLGTGVLFLYSTLLAVLSHVLSDIYFDTYIAYGKRMSYPINENIWRFSPASMLIRLFLSPNNTTMEAAKKLYKYDTSYVWVLMLAAAVYTMAAYIAHQRRASEAAGKSIAFHMAEPVIKTMVVIPAAFFCAVFFRSIASYTKEERWFVFGLIFGFVIACVLMEVIFRLDLRGALMHKKQFLFNAACTALIFAVIRYDMTGYDTYVPSDAQLQSCAISIQQLMPLSQDVRVSSFGNHFLDSEDYRMSNMKLQGNPSAMELARKAAAEQLQFRYFDYYEGIEESSEYMETLSRQEHYQNLVFGYRLQNGRMIYRKYVVDLKDAETLRLLADIFNDYDYKVGSTPVFNDSWQIEFGSLYCISNFREENIVLTHDMQARLLETYHKEYMKLTLDTVMHELPLGSIDFRIQLDANQSRYKYFSYSGAMYIYPEFTKTIALLREYGFDMEEKLTAEDVESVRVELNDVVPPTYFSSLSGIERAESVYETDLEESEVQEYTDKEQIQQILDSVVKTEFMWGIKGFTDCFDHQYRLGIILKAEDGLPYYFFIKGEIPDFIRHS